MNAFHCDLTEDSLKSHLSKCNVDIVTLVFVLSAIHPDKMLAVLQNIIQVISFCHCLLFNPAKVSTVFVGFFVIDYREGLGLMVSNNSVFEENNSLVYFWTYFSKDKRF